MTRHDMSIKVERKLHDMRISGRIVGVRSTEQSVRHLLIYGKANRKEGEKDGTEKGRKK